MGGKETVVIVGSGGREAALAEKYSESDHVGRIIAIPGNDMMRESSRVSVELVPQIDIKKPTHLASYLHSRRSEISLVDIAPEDVLAQGVVDRLTKIGIPTFGPTKAASQIEWDKYYARLSGGYWGLPQPQFMLHRFELTANSLGDIMTTFGDKEVAVKANGLAAGKGVILTQGEEGIERAITKLRAMQRLASSTIVIEEKIQGRNGEEGEEFSAFVLSSGTEYQIVGFAQDHKRALDGDKGDNTGGMGAVSNPLLLQDEQLRDRVIQIFEKTFRGLNGVYKGVLYLGGMAVDNGNGLEPYVVEFNSRWGDPEAQVLLPGLEVDLFELSMAIARGESLPQIRQDNKVRVAVAGVAKGYPGNYSQAMGKKINGIDNARATGATVYGANVLVEGEEHKVNGGRLFYVGGIGDDVVQARAMAYGGMKVVTIEGDNLHFRTDIGNRDVRRLGQL